MTILFYNCESSLWTLRVYFPCRKRPSISMSSIHYKFRALKDYDTYTFEGAGVPVWELKQEIIAAKKLNRANDFDLLISNAQTNQGKLRGLVEKSL
jgi:hypothetical protein